jgi:hypothetical protein
LPEGPFGLLCVLLDERRKLLGGGHERGKIVVRYAASHDSVSSQTKEKKLVDMDVPPDRLDASREGALRSLAATLFILNREAACAADQPTGLRVRPVQA